MTTPEHHWHWSEGNKYAIEGMKTLLLLNGGAAVVLLTFVGTIAQRASLPEAVTTSIGRSLLAFGFGTVCAVVVFIAAYETQLQYGNENRGKSGARKCAIIWHIIARAFVFVSILSFLGGVLFAHDAVMASLKIAPKP